MNRRSAREAGQVSVLIVGFFLVAALLVVAVVDASAAFLRRQELAAVADAAALAAADGVRTEQIYLQGVPDRVSIDPLVARALVERHLSATGVRRELPGLRYRVTTTADTVHVEVTTRLELPLVPPGWLDDTRVAGDAAAIVQVTD